MKEVEEQEVFKKFNENYEENKKKQGSCYRKKKIYKRCSKLERVVIGKAVKTISSKAFIGDNKIKKITFKGKKLKTVKKNAFSKKAKENIKSKKTKLKGNKKAIKLFKKKLTTSNL